MLSSKLLNLIAQYLTRNPWLLIEKNSTLHPYICVKIYQDAGKTSNPRNSSRIHNGLQCNYQQNHWSELLPLAEFADNSTPYASTRVSPFFANKGYHPHISVYPKRDISSCKARDFTVDLLELHDFLKSQFLDSQETAQRYANKKEVLFWMP